MKKYIGIDLGGTHVRVGVIDEKGNVLESVKSVSYGKEGRKKVVDNIISIIKTLDYKKCVAIGMCVPGPVDAKKNVMMMSTNIKGLKGYDIAKDIKKATGLDTYLDNDANIAALAEACVGAGTGKDVVYYVTQSTGIGGGLVINENVVSGKNGYAGEIANIIIDRNGEKINHLNAGAVENEASGTAMARKAKAIYKKEITAREVFALAKQGDPKAKKIVSDMAYDMAQLLSTIGHVVDPDCFVLGGGCTSASSVYFKDLKKHYKEMVHEPMKKTPILKAKLAEPGLIGAGMLARVRSKKK